MNQTYTLKELADIGAVAANLDSVLGEIAREAFTKAVLDAIGYEFPKDEEREAFERWQKSAGWDLRDSTFEAWKAGREELRKETCSDKCGDAKPKEPAWIPWAGGECPLADTVKRWEYRARDQFVCDDPLKPSKYDWKHYGLVLDIVAYRVWEE